jgi:sensor histidine kinase YesM
MLSLVVKQYEFKQTQKEKIGNKNVRRRLELLYNSKFELSTSLKENMYRVRLKIPI